MKLRYRKRRVLGAVLAYYRRIEAMGFTRVANLGSVTFFDGVIGKVERLTFITSPRIRTHAGKRHYCHPS